MAQLTPEQRYRQAMQFARLRVMRSIRLFRMGKVGWIEGADERGHLIREIGRAYDAGFAAGIAASNHQESK